MAGIMINASKVIIHVETSDARPDWIEDASKLNKEKGTKNAKLDKGEHLEMCHKLAYALICKYIRKALKGKTLDEAAQWFETDNNWVDPSTKPRRMELRWQKQMPLTVNSNLAPNTANIGAAVDEWLKNANSYVGNLWLDGEKLNNQKANFLKEAMRHCRLLSLGPVLYGPYNWLWIALHGDIVGEATDNQPCDLLWRSYKLQQAGAPVLHSNNNICRSISKTQVRAWFQEDDCQIVVVTTNLPTHKVSFSLEACGGFKEGAVLLYKDQIYKVSRAYDPVKSFDFRNGDRTFNIGGTNVSDFKSLKDCLLFGSLHLDGTRGEELDDAMKPLLANLFEKSGLGWMDKQPAKLMTHV